MRDGETKTNVNTERAHEMKEEIQGQKPRELKEKRMKQTVSVCVHVCMSVYGCERKK